MKQYAVIGCGLFGASIAKTLHELGNEVLVIDKSEELIQSISEYVTHAIVADATDENTMKAIGLNNFDVVAIAVGTDIQSSVLITLIVKEFGVEQIIVKANDDLHAKALLKLGADKVVFPERDMGKRLAYNLNAVNLEVIDFIDISGGHQIVEIEPPEGWLEMSIKDLDIRNKHGLNIVSIKDENDNIIIPGGDTVIKSSHVLYILGDTEDIKKI